MLAEHIIILTCLEGCSVWLEQPPTARMYLHTSSAQRDSQLLTASMCHPHANYRCKVTHNTPANQRTQQVLSGDEGANLKLARSHVVKPLSVLSAATTNRQGNKQRPPDHDTYMHTTRSSCHRHSLEGGLQRVRLLPCLAMACTAHIKPCIRRRLERTSV